MIDLSSNHIEVFCVGPPTPASHTSPVTFSFPGNLRISSREESEVIYVLLNWNCFFDCIASTTTILMEISFCFVSQNHKIFSSWDWNFINNHFTTIELSLSLPVFIFHLSQETRIYFRKCTFPIVFARYEQQISRRRLYHASADDSSESIRKHDARFDNSSEGLYAPKVEAVTPCIRYDDNASRWKFTIVARASSSEAKTRPKSFLRK